MHTPRDLCALCASAVNGLGANSPQRRRARRDYAETICLDKVLHAPLE